jgi:predicted O-methyltransferase YrrM
MKTCLEIEAELPRGSFSQYDIAIMLPELKKLKKDDIYLEVGVQYGRSLYLAAKYSKAKVYGVDIDPTTFDPEVMGTLEYDYYDQGSEKLAWQWERESPGLISLLFIDGNHSYHGCARDIESWTKYVKPGGIILFHDCDESSPGVIKAVEEFYGGYETFKESVGQTSIARVVV